MSTDHHYPNGRRFELGSARLSAIAQGLYIHCYYVITISLYELAVN